MSLGMSTVLNVARFEVMDGNEFIHNLVGLMFMFSYKMIEIIYHFYELLIRNELHHRIGIIFHRIVALQSFN